MSPFGKYLCLIAEEDEINGQGIMAQFSSILFSVSVSQLHECVFQFKVSVIARIPVGIIYLLIEVVEL